MRKLLYGFDGMRIKTIVEFSGVAKGTEGEAEWDKDTNMHWKVTWDLKTHADGTPRFRPLVDWFDKEEFEKYLVKI